MLGTVSCVHDSDAQYREMPDNSIPSQKCRDTNIPGYF